MAEADDLGSMPSQGAAPKVIGAINILSKGRDSFETSVPDIAAKAKCCHRTVQRWLNWGVQQGRFTRSMNGRRLVLSSTSDNRKTVTADNCKTVTPLSQFSPPPLETPLESNSNKPDQNPARSGLGGDSEGPNKTPLNPPYPFPIAFSKTATARHIDAEFRKQVEWGRLTKSDRLNWFAAWNKAATSPKIDTPERYLGKPTGWRFDPHHLKRARQQLDQLKPIVPRPKQEPRSETLEEIQAAIAALNLPRPTPKPAPPPAHSRSHLSPERRAKLQALQDRTKSAARSPQLGGLTR